MTRATVERLAVRADRIMLDQSGVTGIAQRQVHSRRFRRSESSRAAEDIVVMSVGRAHDDGSWFGELRVAPVRGGAWAAARPRVWAAIARTIQIKAQRGFPTRREFLFGDARCGLVSVTASTTLAMASTLPNSSTTPGAIGSSDPTIVCVRGYSRSVRAPYSYAEREFGVSVLRAYSIPHEQWPGDTLDHLLYALISVNYVKYGTREVSAVKDGRRMSAAIAVAALLTALAHRRHMLLTTITITSQARTTRERQTFSRCGGKQCSITAN
jgi:hypothetical protein